MQSEDDIQYALEMTKVIHEPDRRIDTFGETRFEFQLISELMDQVGVVKIRTGEVEAHPPRIIRPDAYREIAFEGFESAARERFERMIEKFRKQGHNLAFLHYGFSFKRSKVHEEVVHESIETVKEQVLAEQRRTGNPNRAIIEGVDDSWEIGVLKFTFEMILKSREINAFDFKRKDMI